MTIQTTSTTPSTPSTPTTPTSPAAATPAGRSTGTAEAEVRAQESERVAALLGSDGARYAALADERLLITHSTGRREDGPSFVRILEAGHLRYDRLDQVIETVVVNGRTAVVSGRMNADLYAGGAVRQVDALSTAVWVRRSRRWRLVSYQTTAAERPPAPPENASA